MKWLKKFMYGRYGLDDLSVSLMILSFILMLLFDLLPRALRPLSIISYIPIAIYLYRIFSKNIFKRQNENYKYLVIKNSMLSSLKLKSERLRDYKTHKYFICPKCKQRLRVPRKKGNITITCPKCKNVFKAKS